LKEERLGIELAMSQSQKSRAATITPARHTNRNNDSKLLSTKR